MERSSSKRKRALTEDSADALVESKSFKIDSICGICQNEFEDQNASKACPNSDKHDFHKECLSK